MHELIRDITFSIGAAWLLGIVAQFLRQPPLLAYLVGGFALGPAGLKLIQSAESIEAISELGLIFLLFMIGLEIDLKKIASAGRSITLTAVAQIFGGLLLGVLFFRLCGFGLRMGSWDALYLAVAAALSSTVIIVKVLYEKQELDTLTGRITLGVLVLQDLAAILFLAIQPNLENLAPAVLFLSLGARRAARGGGARDQPLRAAGGLPHGGALAGAGAGRRARVVFPPRRARGTAASLARDGRAHRGRGALDFPLRARCHRQGDEPARLLRHALFRRAGHEDPVPDRRRSSAGRSSSPASWW